MKIFSCTILFLVFTLSAQAQFGVNGKYVLPGDNWQLLPGSSGQDETSSLFDKGWSAGIDYWFRLKNKRVEFLPELNYMQLGNSLPAYDENSANVYSFYFNTNIYFLDFAGDCDCPTWSKEGPTLKKGLFLQLSPGVSYWDATVGSEDSFFAERQVAFSIGGGLGFDLGLNDLVTLTPMLNVRYFSEINFDSLDVIDTGATPLVSSTTANPVIWSAGLRVGIRLDN